MFKNGSATSRAAAPAFRVLLSSIGSLAAFLVVAAVFVPRDAAAQCAPLTGTVNCTVNPGPQSFTNPPVNEVDYTGLTSNITATGAGQAGAQLTSNPRPATMVWISRYRALMATPATMRGIL